MKKKKKYFMNETNDELKFGDMIVLNLTKNLDDGTTVHQHVECKFMPDLVSDLLENEVIREEEVEGEDNTEKSPDFTDECPLIEDVFMENDALKQRIITLEKEIKDIKSSIILISHQVNDCIKSLKDAK